MWKFTLLVLVVFGISNGQKLTVNSYRKHKKTQPTYEVIDNHVVKVAPMEDSGTVITETQTMSAYFSNPTDNFQEFVIVDVLPPKSVLKSLKIYEVSQSTKERTSVEIQYLNNRKNSVPITAPRDVDLSASGFKSMKMLSQNELRKYTSRKQSDLYQLSGVYIRAEPNTDYEFNLDFAEEILSAEEQQRIKGLYSSQMIFNVLDTGYAIEGMVKSPGYPFYYPPNADTKWLIHIPLRHLYTLQFTLTELDTEACCDKLYVYRGTSDIDPLLAMYSGSYADVANSVINTNSPDLFVRFQSDCSSTLPGTFAFTYTTAVAEELKSCNSRTTLPNAAGYITSVGYPSDYPENSACSWLIVSEDGYYPVLYVNEYDFEEGDYVSVYDVYQTGPNRLIKTLTKEDIGTYVSGSGEVSRMSIEMYTGQHDYLYKGFAFNYNQKQIPSPCTTGVVITGEESGVIESPNYPNAYGNSQSCEWKINAKDGEGIYIRFTDLDLENLFDYVYIFDGTELTDAAEIAGLTGSEAADAVFASKSNSITVVFLSDSDNDDYRGFQMEVSGYTKTQNCSGNVTTVDGVQGFITTPNYPNPFPSDTSCQYLIEVKYGYVVSLVIPDINVNVENDLLIIYDGSTVNDTVLFNSNGIPRLDVILFNSTSDKVLVTFSSGSNLIYRGFSLRFFEIDIFGLYAGIIDHTGPQGAITSPSYPSKYPNYITASWQITTPRRTTVSLIIQEYRISEFDTLTGYDGTSTVADVLFVCQGWDCHVADATGNNMLLVFDGKVSNSGFYINYFASGGDCDVVSHEVSEEQGYISSPNFPDFYPNGVSCNHTIDVSQVGNTDHLILFDINVMQSENYYDYLRIYDGLVEDESKLLYQGTGTKSETQFYSNSDTALVVWEADGSVNYLGYNLGWAAVETKSNTTDLGLCAFIDVITNLEGQIFSPAYPDNYPGHVDYCWQILVADGYSSVDFFFPRFQTEPEYDWLAFYDGVAVDESALLRKISGGNLTKDFNISGKEILVHFHADGSIEEFGFLAHYVVKRF